MKLLLTSAGVRNQSIADALISLLGKPASEVKVGFITTAANVEEGNKDWFVAQLDRMRQYGFSWIDIVDISAPGVNWKKRLGEVDVILVSGGNTFHLLNEMRKVEFAEWFKTVADTKIYVGISAGTIVVTPSVAIASVDGGDPNLPGLTDLSGFNFVDFETSPHTPEMVSHKGNQGYRGTIKNDLYEMDDETAIKVVDGNVEMVSEGKWSKI